LFNKRLRESRIKTKYTQQNMADILGITLNAYQKYEQAERFPSYDCLVKIADALNVSTDYLLCRDKFLESRGVYVDESL
jgi:transcriptional regulator with XRE-family HTH domain